ncbi:hypothetical protein VNO80_29290 [Phaseolus coccineus]|uniref:HD-Zip IV C-terminal domain-containing protein n=1 Tax=Phaseolus coccineus TaxID=3886 RepID=A0AAN9QES4_PHACN
MEGTLTTCSIFLQDLLFSDGTTAHGDGGSIGDTGIGGSLLTVAFQIDSGPMAKLSLGSVTNVNNLIACIVHCAVYADAAVHSMESADPFNASTAVHFMEFCTSFNTFLAVGFDVDEG